MIRIYPAFPLNLYYFTKLGFYTETHTFAGDPTKLGFYTETHTFAGDPFYTETHTFAGDPILVQEISLFRE